MVVEELIRSGLLQLLRRLKGLAPPASEDLAAARSKRLQNENGPSASASSKRPAGLDAFASAPKSGPKADRQKRADAKKKYNAKDSLEKDDYGEKDEGVRAEQTLRGAAGGHQPKRGTDGALLRNVCALASATREHKLAALRILCGEKGGSQSPIVEDAIEGLNLLEAIERAAAPHLKRSLETGRLEVGTVDGHPRRVMPISWIDKVFKEDAQRGVKSGSPIQLAGRK
jgi:hypothetical protein